MYFIVSMGMVFVNKMLLSDSATSMPAPLFVTWFQCVVTVVIVVILGEMGKGSPKGSFYAQFPQFEYNLDKAFKVAPLSVMFVAMIAFNNLCLQYVEVSFYQVARALTMVFNVVLSFILLGEKTSFKSILCCFVMIAGFWVGVDNEVHFSLIGTIFGVISSMFVSLNAIYTKKVMSAVDGDSWKLTLYNNINAALLFPPLIIIAGEDMIILDNAHLIMSGEFWFKMLLGGVFGTMIGIIITFQINLTSPLTHNIAGTAKAALQTVIALYIYQNPITSAGAFGIFLVLFGSFLYAYVRMLEMDAAKAAQKASKAAEEQANKDVEMSKTQEPNTPKDNKQ